MKAHDWHTEVEGTGDTVCRRCGAVYHRCSGGAERAVIKAAKAYKHGWHNGQNMDVLRDALFEALEGDGLSAME